MSALSRGRERLYLRSSINYLIGWLLLKEDVMDGPFKSVEIPEDRRVKERS